MADTVLRIEALTKHYADLVALDEVSLTIDEGEIFALLGPNGAGKTTLIGCLNGLVRPTSGRAFILGHDVVREGHITRQHTGLVPQELNFDPFFSVRQVLRFQMGFFGVRPSVERVSELLRILSLEDKADENTRFLSGGMKRRLLIAKALVHDPKLLFLDEPTAGVDVELRDELWSYVRDLRDRGKTILLTTHYLHEAEELADRVGILREGRLIEVSSVSRLIERFGTRIIRFRLSRRIDSLPQPLADLGATVGGDGWEVCFRRDGADDHEVGRLLEAIGSLNEADARVVDLVARPPTLEEVFRTLLKDQTRTGGTGP